MTIQIKDYLDPANIILDLQSCDKQAVLEELSNFAWKRGLVPDQQTMYESLMMREELVSTGIGDQIALPHARFKGPNQLNIILARSLSGVDFDALDGEAVSVFVTIIGPEDQSKNHLQIMAHMARLLKHSEFRQQLLGGKSAEEILQIISAIEEQFDPTSPAY